MSASPPAFPGIAAGMSDIESERSYLLRFARKRLSDAYAAEDAVQETLLAALTAAGHAGGFMGRSSLRTWLTAILHHKVMDAYRRNATDVRMLDSDTDAESVAASNQTDDPAAQLEQKQLSLTLLSAIDELPARQRDVFVLYQMQGCSGDEIARRVGLSCNNVWVTLHRARRSLRVQLRGADVQPNLGLGRRRAPVIHDLSHA